MAGGPPTSDGSVGGVAGASSRSPSRGRSRSSQRIAVATARRGLSAGACDTSPKRQCVSSDPNPFDQLAGIDSMDADLAAMTSELVVTQADADMNDADGGSPGCGGS